MNKKIFYFEAKTSIQEEKISKYFEKLVIQVWIVFFNVSKK